jgi:hypothetical protein
MGPVPVVPRHGQELVVSFSLTFAFLHLSMTIIFSAKRDRFALVACDRMHKETHANGKITCRAAEKLVYHREHPLACAIAGEVAFPANTSPQIKVQEVLDSFASISPLSGQRIAETLNATIGPLITGSAFLKIWIVLIVDGKPSVTWCQIPTDPLDVEPNGEGEPNYPLDLIPFYQQNPKLFTTLQGNPEDDWSVVCQHAINAVAAGIHEESRRNGGQNIECGLGIDIAILSCEFGVRRCHVPASQFPNAKYPAS